MIIDVGGKNKAYNSSTRGRGHGGGGRGGNWNSLEPVPKTQLEQSQQFLESQLLQQSQLSRCLG